MCVGPVEVCFVPLTGPSADIVETAADDLGCVKTREEVVSALAKSFMREQHSARINLAPERPADWFSRSQDPKRTFARFTRCEACCRRSAVPVAHSRRSSQDLRSATASLSGFKTRWVSHVPRRRGACGHTSRVARSPDDWSPQSDQGTIVLGSTPQKKLRNIPASPRARSRPSSIGTNADFSTGDRSGAMP
jgi:hypothetical protein